MALEIIEPGMSTTVQDRGRIGYYKYGFPQSGSLDQYSATLGNRLVGNTPEEAVLECTYIGPKFVSNADAVIAITGAPVDVFVNDEQVSQYEQLHLHAGDQVRFGVIKGGTRYYIAVRGGIDVPKALGSRSTYPIGRIGGVNGRILQAGDEIKIGAPVDNGLRDVKVIDEADRPVFGKEVEVRVMMGLYDHYLSDKGRSQFLDEPWTLTPVADRMGMRYDGPGVDWAERRRPFGAGQDPSNIVDAGYAVGSIQIPGGSQPIILHREAVSGGGYAQVGTVISADMDVVARSAPCTKTRFVSVNMDEALAARKAYQDQFNKIWS